MIRPADIARTLPLRDVKWISTFQPQRSDPDLRAVPLGFLAFILCGTAALKLPWAHGPGQSLSWLDSFFLSTSSVCVTGLAPVNVAEVLNGFGHAILFVLIQVGGLGIVTASLALLILSGKKLSLAHENAVTATIGQLQRARPTDLFRFSCLSVALIETAGAALLYWELAARYPGANPFSLIWQAFFHSVSAFCNAGFSIYPEGLVAWRGNPVLLGAIDVLVIAGGIGLISLVNLRHIAFWRRDPRKRGRLTLQTKLSVAVSLLLLAGGTAVTLLFEWNYTLAGQPFGQKLSWAAFHSTMTRTAGFNVVDLNAMHPATLAFALGLMFVGGSPGSMAGGIKTVTFAVLLATAHAALTRRDTVELYGRRIDPRSSGIALMIALIASLMIASGITPLMFTEFEAPSSDTPNHWLGIVFEAVSAFCTVGLSAGVTPLLTGPGKLVIIVMMFIGRVAPLMLAVYLARPMKPWHVRHAEEHIALG